MQFKKIMVVLILVLASTDSFAGWIKAMEVPALIAYVNPSTVHQKGNDGSLIAIFDMKSPLQQNGITIRSMKRSIAFNCANRQFVTLHQWIYETQMAAGKPLSESAPAQQDWQPVPQNSVIDVLSEIACAPKKPH